MCPRRPRSSPPCLRALQLPACLPQATHIYFPHALTLHRNTPQHTPDADNARQQEADTYTTEGLDWHQPHHTATDQLAQPRQWLRQISTQVPISTTVVFRQASQRAPIVPTRTLHGKIYSQTYRSTHLSNHSLTSTSISRATTQP